MRICVHRAFVTALALAMVSLACAATYVVDGATGDDVNDGIDAPFKTIARGMQAVAPGDTLRIVPMDHPYPETMSVRTSGTAEAPITIDGGGATLSGADLQPKTGWEQQGDVFGSEPHTISGVMVFTIATTATESSSWSNVKSLY